MRRELHSGCHRLTLRSNFHNESAKVKQVFQLTLLATGAREEGREGGTQAVLLTLAVTVNTTLQQSRGRTVAAAAAEQLICNYFLFSNSHSYSIPISIPNASFNSNFHF